MMKSHLLTSLICLALLIAPAQVFAGCSQGVSTGQYNALQAELKSTQQELASVKSELAALKNKAAPVTTQDQLAAPRKTLASLQPYLELDLLILDNDETLMLRNTKEITSAYADMQYAEQRNKLDAILEKFDDTDFAGKVRTAWSESADTRERLQGWAITYGTLRTNLQNSFDTLDSQLNP